MVAAHLGNDASLCALSGGQSVHTSMGMAALDGLPTGSRGRTLDPGVVMHLARSGIDPDEVDRLLYEESGQGSFGISNDAATLLASRDPCCPAGARLFHP